ncbi:MAG: hypothetical protein ACLVJH_11415 [Faecalibacterium prausnitzii]
MRTNGMKTIDMTFQAMVLPPPPSRTLTCMGLKTGVADGQENPLGQREGA